MYAVVEERQTVFTGCFKRLKHGGGRQNPSAETDTDLMDTPFIRSYEEVAYEGQLSSLMTQLHGDAVNPEGASLNLWCDGFDLREDWFVDNQAYWEVDIDFEIRFRQLQEEWRRFFGGWHNIEVFSVPPAR